MVVEDQEQQAKHKEQSMTKTHPSDEDVKQVELDTYSLLEEIGLPYKKVSRYERIDNEGTAIWFNEGREFGRIDLYRGLDTEAVAHELGHGFHERLREGRSLPYPFREPHDGEAVAEAIRFFVEQRRGSSWQPQQDKQTLEACHYDFEEFKLMCRKIDAIPRIGIA
jgi:hypothetical protein